MACRPEADDEVSAGALIGTLVGGPMMWACRASHFLRPSEMDDSDEDVGGLPFWRQVRRIDLDVRAYLAFLGVPALARGRVETLETLLEAHRRLPTVERTHGADVRRAYGDATRGVATSEAERTLLLGWVACRLELFFEVKFVLARRIAPEARVVEYAEAKSIRAPQPPCWGPATHVLLFVAPSPDLKRLVDVSLPEPVDLLPSGTERDLPTWRVAKKGALYVAESLDGDEWRPKLLFDTRIKRPHSHFFAGNGPARASERACVDVDGFV